MTGPITVLLVEDHESYREALQAVMAAEPDLSVVAQAGRADDAGARASAARPAVALVDLDLPGGSGVDAILDIRRESPGTACVVLTGLTDDVELGRAIEAGAAGVLHKSVAIPSLLAAVRTAAGGGSVLTPEVTTRALQAVARLREQSWYARRLGEQLSNRERQVLARLADGAGNRDIAEEFGISAETVQTHVRNLLGKMGVGSRLEAVVKAIRLGLVDPPS